MYILYAVAQPAFPQTSKMKSFVTIVKGFQTLTIFEKLSIVDVSVCPGYGSGMMYLMLICGNTKALNGHVA